MGPLHAQFLVSSTFPKAGLLLIASAHRSRRRPAWPRLGGLGQTQVGAQDPFHPAALHRVCTYIYLLCVHMYMYIDICKCRFPKGRVLFLGAPVINKGHSILGSVLGLPTHGKPHVDDKACKASVSIGTLGVGVGIFTVEFCRWSVRPSLIQVLLSIIKPQICTNSMKPAVAP